jgi:hypothetical protein
MAEVSDSKKEKKLTLTLSWKLLSIVLIILTVTLVAYIVYLKPWQSVSDNPRTIEITGQASIKRAPDSFVFNPTYEADSQEAITLKTNEVVKAVKDLGLGDAGIQTQVSSYENYGSNGPTGEYKHSVFMTLSVEDKDLAQKIQDYLVTSGSTGQITPMSGFKEVTEKELRDQATTLAVEDAKKRAEQTANNLGVKVVKVISISESGEGIEPMPIMAYDSGSLEVKSTSLPINAGEAEYPYSVKVQFEIR